MALSHVRSILWLDRKSEKLNEFFNKDSDEKRLLLTAISQSQTSASPRDYSGDSDTSML